jgi:hypothetical protein
MIETEIKKVKIVCPICNKSKHIQIPTSIRDADRGTLTTISIPSNLVCQHHFQAYIDKNFDIRGYQKVDFTLNIPSLKQKDEKKDSKKTEDWNLDLFIIKINFSQNTLARLLRSVIFKRKIVYVSDNQVLRDQLNNFFSYLLVDTFRNNLKILDSKDYRQNKKKFKKHLVFRKNEVIRDPYKKEDKDINVEKNITNNFIFNSENESSLIFLRNEIRKLYRLSEGIKTFIESYEGDKISTVDVRKYLQNKFGVEIEGTYLEFLFKIVETYFEVEPPQLYSNLAEFF